MFNNYLFTLQRDKKIFLTGASILFSVSFLIFVVSTFFDLQISNFLTKAMSAKAGKIWTAFCQVGGTYQILPVFFIMILVMTETYNSYSLAKKNISKKYLVWIAHILYFMFYLGYGIWDILKTKNADYGWGVGIDTPLLSTYKLRMYTKIVWFLLSFFILIFITYIFMFRIREADFFLKNQLWITTLKILIFIVITYIIVVILKFGMGRPFYFSNIYNSDVIQNAFEQLKQNHGAVDKGWWINHDYIPWYQPYDFVNHMKQLFTGKFNPNSYNTSFPSGHIVATFILFTPCFYFFETKNYKNSKLAMIFGSIWLIYYVQMTFGMVVYRFHFMTEMMFSTMLCILVLILANKIANLSLNRFFDKSKSQVKKS